MYTSYLNTLAFLAVSVFGTALPRSSSTTECPGSVIGITAYADAEYTGHSAAFVASSWGSCVSIAAQFPAGTAAGVTSLTANPHNQCVVYPNTVCGPGTGYDNDTLHLIGVGYYDLSGPEYNWDNLAQSFQCTPYLDC